MTKPSAISSASMVHYLLAIERIMDRIKMTENATKAICNIRVRLAASRLSLDRVCLFFDFLFAISTDLTRTNRKRRTLSTKVMKGHKGKP